MSNPVARRRAFAKKNNLTIGFTAIADFSSYIGQEYLAGIMQAAEDYGINFINMSSAVHHSIFLDADFLPQYLTKMQFMRAPLLDGLITWASSLSEYMENSEIERLFASLEPLPMVDIGYLDIPKIPSIRIDNSYSVRLMVRHLAEQHGFSHIVFVGTKATRPHQSRMECFKEAMAELSLPCSESDIFMADSLDAKDVAAQVDKILENKNGKPDAILTSSDIIATHIIEDLEKRGISVPDDIAVTGFNNQMAGLTAPSPVTTIDLAYFQRGYKAVELLIDRIKWPNAIVFNRTVQTSLVIRQSCGCFEESVLKAMNDFEDAPSVPPLSQKENVAAYLNTKLADIFPHLEDDIRHNLKKAILEDIYNTNVPPPRTKLLVYFRTRLKKIRALAQEAASVQNQISALRRAVLPLVQYDGELLSRMENIFHALRALHSVGEGYAMIGRAGDFYSINSMTTIAVNLASTENLKQLESILRFKLSELSIPGVVLAISPFLTEKLGSANVSLLIPEPPADIAKMLPFKVQEPVLFPKRLFPQRQRFAVTLELLFHNSRYMGYAYFFMGNENLALYDDIKELLSQTLYKIYVREGKTKAHALIVTDREKLTKTVSMPLAKNESSQHGKLNAKSVTDYLIDHLDEMTDLDKMASYFSLSKSHLTRRCKELTSYSVQTLHERLKIEQAKDLIKSGNMKMNDISMRLGFSNPNYFSNVFKKVTGLSPVNWAERNRR